MWPIFIDNPNSDNGALVAAVALYAAFHMNFTDAYLLCLKRLNTNRIRIYPEQHCLSNFRSQLYAAFGPNASNLNAGRLKVWWHREGYWRTALHMREVKLSL